MRVSVDPADGTANRPRERYRAFTSAIAGGPLSSVTLASAGTQHVDLLVTMMQEFYAEAGYSLDRGRARDSFMELMAIPLLGGSFIVMQNSVPLGYLVLTVTFSMEYGGRAAFLDDLYIRAAYRGKGVALAALASLRTLAVDLGIRAIHLEVGRDNAAALTVYRRTGFVDNDRQLLTLRLAPATHESPSPPLA